MVETDLINATQSAVNKLVSQEKRLKSIEAELVGSHLDLSSTRAELERIAPIVAVPDETSKTLQQRKDGERHLILAKGLATAIRNRLDARSRDRIAR